MTTAIEPDSSAQQNLSFKTPVSGPSALTISNILVFSALFLILAKDYFITIIALRVEWVGIALLLGLAAVSAVRDKIYLLADQRLAIVTALIALSWLGSTLTGGGINSSSYFAAFIVALAVLQIRPAYFVQSLAIIVSLNTAVQVVESITGTFLFSYVDEEMEYDEKALSTSDGALRTKGFYGSPLNAISVAMSLCFLMPRASLYWVILCCASLFGQGRLGLGVGLLGLLVGLVKKDVGQAAAIGRPASKPRNKLVTASYLLILAALGYLWLTYFGSEEAVKRLLEAASSDNSQNQSRLEYWTSSIVELFNYDAIAWIFGRYGYIKSLQGGTESDWLRMLLDNGLIFTLTVVGLLFGRIRTALRTHDLSALYGSVICFFVMTVYPHAQSFPNGLLTWLFLLQPPSTKSMSRQTEPTVLTKPTTPPESITA